MQFLRTPMAAASTAALSVAVAVAAAAAAQDAKIEVRATDSLGAWYTRPVWVAIGIIALVVILVLISLAGRRSRTSIVK